MVTRVNNEVTIVLASIYIYITQSKKLIYSISSPISDGPKVSPYQQIRSKGLASGQTRLDDAYTGAASGAKVASTSVGT